MDHGGGLDTNPGMDANPLVHFDYLHFPCFEI